MALAVRKISQSGRFWRWEIPVEPASTLWRANNGSDVLRTGVHIRRASSVNSHYEVYERVCGKYSIADAIMKNEVDEAKIEHVRDAYRLIGHISYENEYGHDFAPAIHYLETVAQKRCESSGKARSILAYISRGNDRRVAERTGRLAVGLGRIVDSPDPAVLFCHERCVASIDSHYARLASELCIYLTFYALGRKVNAVSAYRLYRALLAGREIDNELLIMFVVDHCRRRVLGPSPTPRSEIALLSLACVFLHTDYHRYMKLMRKGII